MKTQLFLLLLLLYKDKINESFFLLPFSKILSCRYIILNTLVNNGAWSFIRIINKLEIFFLA